jgi:hypothetical protein
MLPDIRFAGPIVPANAWQLAAYILVTLDALRAGASREDLDAELLEELARDAIGHEQSDKIIDSHR